MLLELAIKQLPKQAWGKEILPRADSDAATYDFANVLHELDIRFSIGFDLTGATRTGGQDGPHDHQGGASGVLRK